MVFQAVLLALTTALPDAVYLSHEATVVLNADGTYTEVTSIEAVPLNGRGVGRFSSMSISFREGMETIEVTEARVEHWRGGRGSAEGELSLGPHPILSATSRLESTLREAVVTMPGLEVGDTVFLTVERRIEELPLSPVYCYTFTPFSRDSVANARFSVVNLSGGPLYSTHSGASFAFSGCSPLPGHPLAAHEDTRITIATGSPERLSMDASAVLDLPEHGDCPALESIVETTGGDPFLLRSWVADNISYIGADAGVWPGWSPRSPGETLEDGAGVCRDRSLLLAWLLRKAGYEAYPALATTRGAAPPLVDARYFDHMITVYRTSPGDEWIPLDPTPAGLPHGTGYSFGLRGCSYLPLVPWGEGLHTIPDPQNEDSLVMTLQGDIDMEEGLVRGTLSAYCRGVPLELTAKLFTRSNPAQLEEMFRRFFGAVSCDSVHMEGSTVSLTGSWNAPSEDGYLLLPGLRDISHTGTRLASMLLPAPPDSFRLDAPAAEVLILDLALPSQVASLPLSQDSAGYSCSAGLETGRLLIRETADITSSAEDVTETLLLRSGTGGRTVVLR